jgi:hypothetical protein
LTLFFYKYPYKGYKEIKMKSLSQSEYGELRDLYSSVYAPKADTILEGFTDEDLDLTDEEIEEQVEEVFLECIEEGYDIDEIERAIYEAVDAELEVLNEVTSPAKVAVARMKNKSSASGGEGSGDAGAKARAKLNVSKQKIGGSSEKKASTLSKVKSAASKVKSGLKTAGKVAQGGVGVAARAVGTAQRAASAVKGAAKKGYERGRHGAGGKSSSSSSSSSDGGSSSGGGSSSSSSSSSGGSSSASGESSSSSSSDAPKKRKDGLLKRAIKKVVRGVSKGVSAAAGAVKAGADSITDRARKEELEATGLFSEKEIESIMEAEMSEGYKEIDAKKHGRMYDRYKKLRSAAIKDAQDSGEASGTNRMKMGKMSAVIDKSSENLRKKQTKDQLTGRG